ncbi:MAG: dynamin family protein [Acidimicrobiales bacterium]
MAGDPNSEARSAAVQAALSVVDMGTRAATAYERPDLARRLGHTRTRLLDSSFHVFVVGEYKQGKSSLVNALLNAPICPVDDDIATSAPTAVRYADEASAAVLFRPHAGDTAGAPDELPEPVREQIPIDQVAGYVTEASNPANERRVHAVHVGIPRKLLAGGLVLVDTPGVGGLGSPHTATTLGALPMADALVLVSDASQELTAPELEFLQTARRMCPNVLCVLTKIDFYPAWRKIRDLNAQHLARHGIEAPLICTSSVLRAEALRSNDRALNQESGFAELVAYLQNDIVADAERLTVRTVANDVAAVAGLLTSQFQNERQALQAPDSRELVANLGHLQEKTARLGSNLARWQQTLADGIADLSADLDHDLRGRLRQVGKEADESIDISDPAETWDDFEPWLRRRVSRDVVETYAFMHRRSHEVAARVAEHFDEDREALTIRPDVMDPTRMVSEIESKTEIDTKTMGRGEAIMTGMRGGYMGVLMFGMLGSMLAGLSMLNPASAAIGVVMGRKTLRQEKERQLTLRRNNAKTAHRRYADEVSFVVMKDARDTLRRVQRQLRDFYSARAEELQKTTNEALAAAQTAARSDASTRDRRLRDVNAELERIAALRKRALELAPDVAGTADSPTAGPTPAGGAPTGGRSG